MKRIIAALLALAALPTASAAPPSMKWDPGAESCTPANARVESYRYDAHTVVIRQNPCVDAEANLIYLLAGERRALLIDTGAVEAAGPTVATVTAALQDIGAQALPLLVVHTHGHLDHRAGDAQFAKLPNVRVAPVESAALRGFLGFKDWPDDIAQLDLGGRIVDLIATPGHHPDHIVFYDRSTGVLFSGDFLMPGRLLVEDLDAYRASARRVAQFAARHPVSYAFGAHIELNSDGELFPWGSSYHLNERALPLPPADLAALPAALEEFNGFYSRHRDFVVVDPRHNLIVIAGGAVLAIALLVWLARRLWKRRRAAS
jgi:glyoxylase-like metal-dependent hydrolase (beta-lactamase superfamily II)